MLTDEKVKELVDKYRTPMYVFDISELRQRVRSIKGILGKNIELCYAMKANPFLVGCLSDLVDCIEVCSPGELEICKKANIPDNKIIFSGVYKSKTDFQNLLKNDITGLITIESKLQFEYLVDTVQNSKSVDVIFRLTSGNQFGMDVDDFMYLVRECIKYPNIHFRGIHYFSGTQKKDLKLIRQEILSINDFVLTLKQNGNTDITRVEYGPGLFVDYFGDSIQADFNLLADVSNILNQSCQKNVVELGRYIAASCGYYITQVVDLKRNKDINYCIVDGGIHQVHFFGQILGIKVPKFKHIRLAPQKKVTNKDLWNVCGSLCTIHDYLLRNVELESVNQGDLFIFENAGAYSMTESISLFLSRDLPLILLINDENEFVVREHISISNLNCVGSDINGLV